MNSPYRKLGDWLVEHQSMDVPEEFAAMIDRRRKLAWNIEQCFQKAKENESKLVGTKNRARELEAECARLEQKLQSGDWTTTPEPKKTRGQQQASRTLHLTDNLHVAVGKSGRDNLEILRRAHPWDLWLHVKDRPSAHAVLSRPKGAKISDEILRQAGQWLIRMSLGPKFKDHEGEKFEILSAECRYVSPIKGDHLGRVTYRNERVLRIKFTAA
jgi:predicted ribosome quality control (RQC) complex YloA/Tae2 family protein